jgi:hypothetical protein
MAKTHSTILAEHEIRLGQVERLLPELNITLKSIDKKLDTNYINRREYDKHNTDQTLLNMEIKKELDEIKQSMMTQEQFEAFSRSQFWQKLLTFLGGIATPILIALIIYALTTQGV